MGVGPYLCLQQGPVVPGALQVPLAQFGHHFLKQEADVRQEILFGSCQKLKKTKNKETKKVCTGLGVRRGPHCLVFDKFEIIAGAQ